MASVFKSLFGRGEIEALPEELRKLIESARREKKALGGLVKKAASASQSLKEIAGPLEETRTTIEETRATIEGYRRATCRSQGQCRHR